MRYFIKSVRDRFTALWQPINDPVARRRRNNLTSGLILCNLIFCAIVAACWGFNVQEGVGSWSYISFFAGEFILILIYRGNAWYSRTIAKGIADSLDSHHPTTGAVSVVDDTQPPPGLSIPLLAIGMMNAMLVGFLTYFTGGPSNSPYAQVLVAMLLIAEQTREVKDFEHQDLFRRIIVVSFKEFRWFFALTAVFYIPLAVLQWLYPVHVPTAPVDITIGITAVIFLVGSVTNYLSSSSRDRRIFLVTSPDPDLGDEILATAIHEPKGDQSETDID